MDIQTRVPTLYGDLVQKFEKLWDRQVKAISDKFPALVQEILMPTSHKVDIPTFIVKLSGADSSAAVFEEFFSFLKNDREFTYDFLSDITATDEEADPRFFVVYHLFSHASFSRIRIKIPVRENVEIPTLVNIWLGANWAEREVFDMFGIRFSGHPDLRRILMDERWVGHPLRKDYPLRGYQIFQTSEPIKTHLLDK